MSVYSWGLERETRESVAPTGREWEEVYYVEGYTQGNGPAHPDLMFDRPDLTPGSPHPSVPSAFVDTWPSCDPVDDTDAVRVVVQYKIERENQLDVSPLDRPARITVDPESVEVPTFWKQDGTPWINTAGDLLHGMTRTENRLVFNIEKNLAAWPAWATTYADAVNSDAVAIKKLPIAAHYLLFRPPSIPDVEHETVNGADVAYYPLRFQVVYNPRTWKTKVYNRGLNELVWSGAPGSGTPKKRRILGDDKQPVTEPQFLDQYGQKLPTPLDPNAVATLEGWDHELKAFSALPFT